MHAVVMGAIVWIVPAAALTGLQWFAFVIPPIAVTVFGALLAWASVKLIDRADRGKPAAE